MKWLFVKNSDYVSEEEWRFVVKKSMEQKVACPFASAVYAGYRILDKDFKKLKEICKRNKITLYKQSIDTVRGILTYDLIQGGEEDL